MQKTVQARVAFASGANETCKSESVEVSCVDSIFVNLTDVQLHGTVLLSCDQAVRGRTLAWQIQVDDPALFVLHGTSKNRQQTQSLERNLELLKVRTLSRKQVICKK